MLKIKQLVSFTAVSVFLAACSSSPKGVGFDYQSAQAINKKTRVYVRNVSDKRIFLDVPRGKEDQSLLLTPPLIKIILNKPKRPENGNIIGVYANDYGNRLNYIKLRAESTIDKEVKAFLESAFSRLGYELTKSESDALVVDIDVTRFWAWDKHVSAFKEETLASIELDSTFSYKNDSLLENYSARGSEIATFITDKTVIKAFLKAYDDLFSQLEESLVKLGLQ